MYSLHVLIRRSIQLAQDLSKSPDLIQISLADLVLHDQWELDRQGSRPHKAQAQGRKNNWRTDVISFTA
jgi:hypothetical protein